MTKTYISLNVKHLSTSVKIPTGRAYVTFREYKFTTSDPIIQKAIENDSGYGTEFIEFKNKSSKSSGTKTSLFKPSLVSINTVSNRQQALEYLSSEYDIELGPNTGIPRIQAIAEQHGIKFPNLL